MSRSRRWKASSTVLGRPLLTGLAVLGAAGMVTSTASAFDELVPGKVFVAKPGGNLVKFIGKAPKAGPLFQLPTSNPNVTGATVRVFDTGGAGGDDTYTLHPGQWKELGNPPGSKGYKYKGAGTAADPCKAVVIKEKIVKAVCKDKGAGGVLLTTPFSGTAGAILDVNGDRYCGEWGGTTKKNDDKSIARKDAPAPASCATPGSSNSHQCVFDAGSQMTLETSFSAVLAYSMNGAIDIDCGDGTLDANQTAACTCQLQSIDPITVVGLGTICFEPGVTSCAAGKIDCDGGDDLAWDTVSNHTIGACTGNADCAVQCNAYCPGFVGAGYANAESGCELFCQGGVNDGSPCTMDTHCPGGACNGPDGGLHGSVCQCQCSSTVPPASSAGDAMCQLSLEMKIVPAGAPCTDPPVMELSRCVPLSTEAASSVILNPNSLPGSFGTSATGLPLTCGALFGSDDTTGAEFVGTVDIFDSSFGDLSVLFEAFCQ